MRQKNILKTIVALLLLPLVLLSCGKGIGPHTKADTRMRKWDTMLDEYPHAVLDSLSLLPIRQLSPANRAYHGLLKTIAADKAYVDFTSDSLINVSEQFYDMHKPGDDEHIRSLVYQGIVRIRMGIKDSTAYLPLEKAKRLSAASKNLNPLAGYLLNFYLGELHYGDGNYNLAEKYYKGSLRHARLENSERHIFDAYTALFWNEMTQENHGKGKLHLDTLLNFKPVSAEAQYRILNMQSAYYDMQGEYYRSLQCEKEMLQLLPSIKYKVDEFRYLFSISDKYKSLSQPDSAWHYGQQAIQHITDSTYELNYLLYQNMADIALQQGNHEMADAYRTQMFDAYQHYVDAQAEKTILELEKRYNLSEAENRALQLKTNTRLLSILSVALSIIIVFILLAYRRYKKIARLEKRVIQAEKSALDTKNKLIQAEKSASDDKYAMAQRLAEEQESILQIYSSFQLHYSERLQQHKAFEAKFKNNATDKQKLGESYTKLLQQSQEKFDQLLIDLFPSHKFNNLFAPDHSTLDFLTNNDKLLLIMLSLKLKNKQIAAFLNTSADNLKARKAHLKKKIKENAGNTEGIESILALF